MKKQNHISCFEKLLALWIALCMGLGILMSIYLPGFSNAIDSWQIHGISIPIGICLFLMMYPAMLNFKFSEIKKLGKNPVPIILTMVSNWIVAPVIAAGLAFLFLKDNPQLMFAVILLGSSPCTAMVLVWGRLAEGNQEQNVVNTSINTITIMVLYVPLVSILTGIQDIPIDRRLLAESAMIFIGIPLTLGILSRHFLIRWKGEQWFSTKYRPVVGKIATLALLATLIVLFSLNGQVLLNHFTELLLVSIPLLLGFVIVVSLNLLVTKLFKFKYREAIISVIIGSSSHFEIAIATAVSLYGVGSQAALGTTMGLFWEVPIMLSLVALGKYLNRKGFWGKADSVVIDGNLTG